MSQRYLKGNYEELEGALKKTRRKQETKNIGTLNLKTKQDRKKKDSEEKNAAGTNIGNKTEVRTCREFVGLFQQKNNCTVTLKFPLT